LLKLRKFDKVTSESLDQQFSIYTMIRSTESESVSITCYNFQNVRRESLLLQNQAASEKEKGINAMSNTEKENMNALLFVYEMIKISINEKLNA